MTKKDLITKKTQGILLLICAGLILFNIPFVDEKIIAFILALILGIYNLVK